MKKRISTPANAAEYKALDKRADKLETGKKPVITSGVVLWAIVVIGATAYQTLSAPNQLPMPFNLVQLGTALVVAVLLWVVLPVFGLSMFGGGARRFSNIPSVRGSQRAGRSLDLQPIASGTGPVRRFTPFAALVAS